MIYVKSKKNKANEQTGRIIDTENREEVARLKGVWERREIDERD